MIELNATIFIQMIHFCIAWWALSTFLFKPFVHVVQENRSYKQRLQDTLHKYYERLHYIQEQATRQWHDFQVLFASKIPHCTLTRIISSKMHYKRASIVIDDSQRTTLVREVAQTITLRIMHD